MNGETQGYPITEEFVKSVIAEKNELYQVLKAGPEAFGEAYPGVCIPESHYDVFVKVFKFLLEFLGVLGLKLSNF